MGSSRKQRGLLYVEVMIAVLVLAIAAVPALDALRTATRSNAADDVDADAARARDKMEEVLARPYAELDAARAGASTATAYSDAAGTPRRRVVFLERYDGDNADGDNNPFTGGDAGLLWLQVTVDGTAAKLTTLTRQ